MSASASVAQLEIGFSRHTRGESIDLRWSRWLGEHPHALADFAEIARELLAAGEERISAKFIVEIARYRQIIRRDAGERYAVNNTFTSRVARALEATFEDLRGRFETRALADERAS